MKAANTEIVNALATDKTTMTTKRGVKRKAANNHYTPEVRAKIAKYANKNILNITLFHYMIPYKECKVVENIVVSHLHLASLKIK